MAIVKDIDITPEQRQLVCSIFATHLPDTEVWAYGSRVHWNATPSSDLDLVAFCSDKSGLANCRDAFAESSLPFRVDLFLWDEIPENFQDRIKQEYAVLISKKEVKWDKVKLAETVSLLGDGLHGTPIYNPNGAYTFINGNNLSSGFIIVKEDTKWVSVDEYNKYKKDLTDRTVLVSINGTIGNVALYRGEKCILGKSACYLNVKKEYSRKFIYYVLTHPNFQNYAVSVATGTTIKNVSLKQMRDYEFFCPPLPEQKRIAGILSAFDDKIELNRKMSKMLEAMAEALFKSWFVDFEPVRAKIAAIKNGKDPELAAIMSISGKTEVQLAEMKTFYPDAYSELAHTASLFPSVMVESEQGKIPEGWQAVQLKDVTTQITARIGERKCQVLSAVNSGELVLSVEHFNKQVFSKETNKYILVKPNTYAYNPSRINIGSLGRNKFDFAGCVSPIYVVFSVAEEYISFFDQFFASQTFKDEVLLRASGSVRQALNYSDFGQIALQYPPLPIMQAFNTKIDIISQKLSVLSAEIQTLSNLRDNHLTEFFSISEENEL